MRKQQVLVVDDSPFIRRMMTDWVGSQPDMELAGTAKDGKEGIEMATELRPDVITLDVEMPTMSGLEALPRLVALGIPVLMVSSVTEAGAKATLQALEFGAYDFVTKPNHGASLKFVEVREETLDKVRAARYAKPRQLVVAAKPAAPVAKSDKVVVIASSTGGPSTLRTLWEALPKDFPAPILVVQHMPPGFTASLATRLSLANTVPCAEATGDEKIVPGQAYIAPGGYHMVVGADHKLHLDGRERIHGVKPAADYLFQSAAEVYGSRCVGMVLTGMGRDGADGAVALRRAGGVVLGEAESSCVIYGMPKAAKEAGGIDAEHALQDLATELTARLAWRASRAS